jgi:predicted  nucleic acid-binding Zn-ribbon protein
MEMQMENTRQSRMEIETQILEVMEMVEQFEGEIQLIRTEYDTMVAECRGVEQELKEFRQKLFTEQKQLQAMRKRVILTLPDDLYQQYLKIASQHDGIAVSRVKQDRCSACQMTLSPGIMSRLRLSGEIEYCEFCGRILFCPPPDETKRKGLH